MIQVFSGDVRRDFAGILKWWFTCAVLLGAAMPLLAAAAIWLTVFAFFADGAAASDLAWGFMRDVREPMVAAVAGLHLFGALATFIAYGFGVETSALLFSGGGALLIALTAVCALLVGRAFRAFAFILRAALGEDARAAAFARRFPTFFFPSRTGLSRASNPAGAAPRLE